MGYVHRTTYLFYREWLIGMETYQLHKRAQRDYAPHRKCTTKYRRLGAKGSYLPL